MPPPLLHGADLEARFRRATLLHAWTGAARSFAVPMLRDDPWLGGRWLADIGPAMLVAHAPAALVLALAWWLGAPRVALLAVLWLVFQLFAGVFVDLVLLVRPGHWLVVATSAAIGLWVTERAWPGNASRRAPPRRSLPP